MQQVTLFTISKFTYLYMHVLALFLINNNQCMIMK